MSQFHSRVRGKEVKTTTANNIKVISNYFFHLSRFPRWLMILMSETNKVSDLKAVKMAWISERKKIFSQLCVVQSDCLSLPKETYTEHLFWERGFSTSDTHLG